MSEKSHGNETQPKVIQFCVKPELVILDEPEYVGSSQFASWDLPSAEVVTPVATAIVHAIKANGIDPKCVVLSGYNRRESQASIDEFKRDTYEISDLELQVDDITIQIRVINDELARMDYEGILTQSKRAEARVVIKGLFAQRAAAKSMPAEEKPTTYFFAEHTSMFDNHTGANNPIFYAGSGEQEATVGIYDRAMLADLDRGANGAGLRVYSPHHVLVLMADLSRPQLESTKVMEAHIHYESSPSN